jgi:uncharacterized membrane protein
MGPLEVLVLGFPSEGLPDAAGVALQQIQDTGDVRVVEAALVVKTGPEAVHSEEVTDLAAAGELAAEYGLAAPDSGLMAPDCIAEIAAAMQVDTTALALVLEHRWAQDVVGAFHGVGAIVLASARVPWPTAPTVRWRITGGL